MNGAPVLALSGSNLTGDVPFSCALSIDGRIETARAAPGIRGDLAQLVANLCATCSVRPDQVQSLRVDVGPGSYTGLRVALTFVRFLQHFGNATVQGLDSLALLAARAVHTGPSRVRVLLDARRERVHTQSFDIAPGHIAAVAPAVAVPMANVLNDLRAGDVVIIPASLPLALQEPLRTQGAVLRLQTEVVAAEMFTPGLPFFLASTAELEPRYLMSSYAET